MLKFILLLTCFALTSCVNIKENGHTVFHCSANSGHIHYQSPAGSILDIDNFDPAKVHKTIGVNIAQGSTSVGSAILTSGIIK